MTQPTSSHPALALPSHSDSQSTFKDKLKIKSIVDSAAEDTAEIDSRLGVIRSVSNPLLEAAKPLLLTLAQMPKTLQGTVAIESFRQLLEKDIATFHHVCQKAGIKREHMITASYCLCTALDEAANSTSWGGSHHPGDIGVWASKLLASTMHGDVDGGTKFFLLISKLIKQPQEHLPLLETLYHILCLGFEGQYASVNNGQQRLETIRHRVLTVLTSVRDPLPRELSPRWKPADTVHFSKLGKLPVWITSAVFGLLVFTLFSWYQYQLLATKKHITAELSSIEDTISPSQSAPVTTDISATTEPAQKPSALSRQSDDLNKSLEQDIRKGYLTLTEKQNLIQISLRADQAFESGSTVLAEKILTPLQKIAAFIKANPAAVEVIGHTDNLSPSHHRQAFTEERAGSVAYALQSQGVQEADITITGQGDQSPLMNNRTPANRSHNRRVDILIMKNTAVSEDNDMSFSQ